MALINCPECGKEVSNAAESCPHCGYPIKKYVENMQNKRIEYETQQKKENEQKKSQIERPSVAKKEKHDITSSAKHPVDTKKADSLQKKVNLFSNLGLATGVISALGFLGIFIGFFVDTPIFMIVTLLCAIGGAGFSFVFVQINKSYKLKLRVAKGEFANLEEAKKAEEKAWLEAEIKKAEAAKKQAEEERKRKIEIARAQRPKCPLCGGSNTARISTAGKVVSTAALGLASSTIGKQYQCYDCKHKW